MNELCSILWDSFVAEVDKIMLETAVLFSKPAIETGDIETIFRSFHNVKSNSKLLEFNRLSDTSALGEEICKVLISDEIKRSDEIMDCLRDVYEHARYQFECIKSSKTEPDYKGPDADDIKMLLYGSENSSREEKYSPRELSLFSNIMSGHFANSLSILEGHSRKSVQDSILLIKEAAELLEFNTLAQLYGELYEQWEERGNKSETAWLVTISHIFDALLKIESEIGIDLALEHGMSLVKLSLKDEYVDLQGRVVEILESIVTKNPYGMETKQDARLFKKIEKLTTAIEKLGIFHKIHGIECAYFLSVMVDIVIKYYLGRQENISSAIIETITVACNKILFLDEKVFSESDRCDIQNSIRKLKKLIPDIGVISHEMMAPCEKTLVY